jgi:SAM-dependent methyltransferase
MSTLSLHQTADAASLGPPETPLGGEPLWLEATLQANMAYRIGFRLALAEDAKPSQVAVMVRSDDDDGTPRNEWGVLSKSPELGRFRYAPAIGEDGLYSFRIRGPSKGTLSLGFRSWRATGAIHICKSVLVEKQGDAGFQPAMQSYLQIPILLAGGDEVSRFTSAKTWSEIIRAASDMKENGEEINVAEFLREDHHRYYGRPWILGRYYFDKLLDCGLRPNDRVLDLGCGAGRLGLWLIPYLDSGNYTGIDAHLRSLVAFSAYESVAHGLAAKNPKLRLDDDFNLPKSDGPFDVLLDFFVTKHLAEPKARLAYRKMAEQLQPGAKVYMPHAPRLGIEGMKELGFALNRTDVVQYPLLAGDTVADTDTWHIFIFAQSETS